MIKINVSTSDSYRRLIKQFQADNVVNHTYQPRGERAYRVVLRHLHLSIHPDVIKSELECLGYIARNVFNIRHRLTKAPLPLNVVDLEPYDNNKNIFDHFLCNMKITVEAPRKKNSIVRCTRCQSYGRTKTYCARPFVCVKCGGGMIRQIVPKIPLPRRRAPFVVGPIQLIAISSAVSRQPMGHSTTRPRRLDPRTPTQHVDTSDAHHFPPLLHCSAPPLKPPSTYSNVVASKSQTIELGA